MHDFMGKVVVITGGARGIGRATGEAFAAAGALVVAWDSIPADGSGNGVQMREVDVSSVEAVRTAADELLAAQGRVDVLNNNAGINVGEQGATTLSDATWDTIFDTNLKGAMNAVRALSPAMMRARQGRIVNTGSILATQPQARYAVYCAAKAALLTLTRTWAQELGPHGVTVNAVSPGLIDTPMNEGLDPTVRASLIAQTPVGRMGCPEDVAKAHLFLASGDAGFINGAVLAVDGGLTI